MKRMINRIIMVTVIVSAVSYTTLSQDGSDSGRKQSHLQLGFSRVNVQDKALNKAIHKGPGLHGAWHIERYNNRSVKVIDLELGSGFLKSGFESETATYIFSGSAGFRWLHNLSGIASDLNVYLGGKGEIKTAIEYFDNWDESHFYWVNAYSAGIDSRISGSFGANSRFSVDVNIPVLSIVSRPPAEFTYTQSSPALMDILRDLNYNPGVLSLFSYKAFNLQVKYYSGNPKKFVPAIFLRLNYLAIEKSGSGNLKYLDQVIGLEYIF